MPHRDTSKAIKQAITLALNATQGHKHSYQQAITSTLYAPQGHKHSYQYQQAITYALYAPQVHKLSYQQAITSALNSSLPKTWFVLKSEYLKRSSDYN